MTAKSVTDVDKQVGARIRARRQALQISQGGLAEAVGVTFQQVQKYENGANRVSTSRLAQIADTLQVPVAYFFDGLGGAAGASDLLADPQVAKLLSAFRAIESEDMRRAIVDLALVASGAAGASKEKGSAAGPSGRKQGRSPKVSPSP